ncbi:MAG: SusC/RagA family TonB-linked outer membrane protein [Segetibacter sp.]
MKKLLIIITVLWLPALVLAQTLRITGQLVNRTSGAPLEGVTVKGKTSTTQSGADGSFSINASKGEVITFSSVGMVQQEVKAENGIGRLQIEMDVLSSSLEAVVVTGYTRERKKDLTGAVSVVNLREVQSLPSGNVLQNLQGRVPGVYIQTSGSPGATATVRIRGISTLGNNDPLYVIDGVPSKNGMHELNPNDIESLQVLKDAASASIYGSRAASGVIIITTKQGNKGGPRVEFSTKFSTQHYSTALDPLNTEERARVFWKANVNDKRDPVSTLYNFDWNGDFNNPVLNKVTLPEFIDAEKTMRPGNTGWFKEVSQQSFMQDYNLSVSNGNEKGGYLFSLGYYDNNGVVKASNTNRVSARINSNSNLFNNKVTIGENFTITNERENAVNGRASEILWTSLVQQSIVPIKAVDGNWGGPTAGITNRDNPVRIIDANRQNVSNFNRVLGNAYVDIEPINNLHLRTSYGIDYSLWYLRGLQRSYRTGTISGTALISNNNNRYGSWVWTNTLTYNLAIDNHKLNFLAGTENYKYSADNFGASRAGIAVEDLDYSYLGTATGEQQAYGGGSKNTLQSFFGKLDYVFNDKYLASFTLRRDGSSRFGQNNKYGYFPAVSVGWRVSQENFIKDNLPFISDFKLRASWGQNGNQDNIDDRAIYDVYQALYATRSLFTTVQDNGTAYDLAGQDQGTLPSGFVRTLTANPNLKWETTTQTDVGADFSLFNNKLSGSFDYFIKTTKDVLTLSNPLALSAKAALRIC